MPRKGYKQTEDHKQKSGLATKRRWQNPKDRQRMSLGLRKQRQDPEFGQRMSLVRKRLWQDPEFRQKMSLIHKRLWQDSEYRQKLILAHKRLWQDPSYVLRRMERMNITPNKAEIHLQKLLDTWYPFEWQFVGDGKLVIDGLCPDFVNINGKKQLIELDGEYWHKDRDSQEKIDRYVKLGYYCLVVQYDELKNEAILYTKVENFVNSYPYKIGLVHRSYYALKRLELRFRKIEYTNGESANSTRSKKLWQDPEFRQKLVEKHRTKESRQKKSLVAKKLWQDPEYRRRMSLKMSLGLKKRWQDSEFRQKMNLANIGKYHTEETKQKMSLAQKARWAIVNKNN